MGVKVHSLFYVFINLIGSLTCGVALAAEADFPGYVSNVQAERDERFYEIFLFNTPPPKEASLKDRIFNDQLSKEFKERYREKFGELDTSSISYQKAFKQVDENRSSVDTQEETEKRRSFAEYVTRRVMEWHVDNYVKSEPTMRPVYEAKERLSNIEVKVTQQSKVDFKYSFAGNIMDIVYTNPWLDSKLSLEMDPKAFGPSTPQEQKLYLGKAIDTRLYVKNTTAFNDGITSLELIRQLRWNWATSIGDSINFKSGGTSPRENRVALGVSHAY